MKLWVVVAWAAVGCKSETAAPSAPPAGSAVAPAPADAAKAAAAPSKSLRLVTTGGLGAQIIEIGATTAKLVATVKLPLGASALVWVGKDPVALLTQSGIPDGPGDPKLDGTVGTITPAGFAALPSPSEAAWAMPHSKGSVNLGPHWRLAVSEDGEPWLAMCSWGGIEDGGHCDDWMSARVGGPFELSALADVPSGEPTWTAPTVPAAPGYQITFAPTSEGNDFESIMTCSGGGKKTTLPNGDSDPAFDKKSITWLSTDPPIFTVDRVVNGFVPHAEMAVFEGCEESPTFGSYVQKVAGPDGLVVVAGSGATSILRNGKILASFGGADHVAFEPPAIEGVSPLGVLEKQLAGDWSMFAKDAIVLAPGPAAFDPPSMPHGIKRARLTSYDSWYLHGPSWLAAEAQLTTTGPARTYRIVELIDESGHVVVASFAPLAPLARGAPLAAIDHATPAGPLADVLTDPKAAAAALADHAAIFGTDPGEHASSSSDLKKLLGDWSALKLSRAPEVREVHAARWGYAIANIDFAKPGGQPYRMTALAIGAPDAKGTWRVAAIHYLAR